MRKPSDPPIPTNVDAATLAAFQRLADVAIERAQAGDADAGMDALRWWLDARRHGVEVPELEAHVEHCIEDVLNGVHPDVALRIHAAGARGAPPDPSKPARRRALAAMAVILESQGVETALIKDAMSEAHQAQGGGTLDDTDANKIRREYPGLEDLNERMLIELCDEKSRVVIRKYCPST